MLNHTLLKEADALEGVHAAAFNRICNQVRKGVCSAVRNAGRIVRQHSLVLHQ